MKFMPIAVLLVFSFTKANAQASTYQKSYPKAYQEASAFVESHKPLIASIAKKYKIEVGFLIAIAFPEIVRYSEIRNMIESTSLELLYTRFGKSYANFSIGKFQMKPSFIESLEYHVKKYRLNALQFVSQYKQKDDFSIRQERLKRMKSLNWQLKYLACFCKIIEKKFEGHWKDTSSKVRFFASAYNRGFENSATEIKRWSRVRAFPHGLGQGSKQFSYSTIAWNFYRKYAK